MNITARIDRELGLAYAGTHLYRVLDCPRGAQVHDATGRWLGRIDRDGIAPALFGARLKQSARRRKALRALGAIQRAWYAQAPAPGEDRV